MCNTNVVKLTVPHRSMLKSHSIDVNGHNILCVIYEIENVFFLSVNCIRIRSCKYIML